MKNTVKGQVNLDMVNNPPMYLDIVEYSCPEGYVFEIYQEYPNMSINYGLVEDEQPVLNLTCASYGDWLPLTVPQCIRNLKYPIYHSILYYY